MHNGSWIMGHGSVFVWVSGSWVTACDPLFYSGWSILTVGERRFVEALVDGDGVRGVGGFAGRTDDTAGPGRVLLVRAELARQARLGAVDLRVGSGETRHCRGNKYQPSLTDQCCPWVHFV